MARDPRRSFAGAATPEWQAAQPAPPAPPPPAWPGPDGSPPPVQWGAGSPPLPVHGEGLGERPASPSPGYPLGPMRGGYALPGQPPGAPPGTPGPLAPPLAPQATPPATATSPAGWGNSSLGMAATHAASLSYCGWWLTGLLIYFNERQSRFVRFHALQSTIFTGMLTVASVLAYVAVSLLQDAYLATHQHVYDTLSTGVALLAFVVILAAWWVPMIAAWHGFLFRIPFIAPYAERYAPPVPPDYGELGGP